MHTHAHTPEFDAKLHPLKKTILREMTGFFIPATDISSSYCYSIVADKSIVLQAYFSSIDPSKICTSNAEKVECWYKNGGCWQYCQDTAHSLHVICSCTLGYELHEDGKSCTPSGKGSIVLIAMGGFRCLP